MFKLRCQKAYCDGRMDILTDIQLYLYELYILYFTDFSVRSSIPKLETIMLSDLVSYGLTYGPQQFLVTASLYSNYTTLHANAGMYVLLPLFFLKTEYFMPIFYSLRGIKCFIRVGTAIV